MLWEKREHLSFSPFSQIAVGKILAEAASEKFHFLTLGYPNYILLLSIQMSE